MSTSSQMNKHTSISWENTQKSSFICLIMYIHQYRVYTVFFSICTFINILAMACPMLNRSCNNGKRTHHNKWSMTYNNTHICVQSPTINHQWPTIKTNLDQGKLIQVDLERKSRFVTLTFVRSLNASGIPIAICVLCNNSFIQKSTKY